MLKPIDLSDIVEIHPNCFEIPSSFRSDMRVPARVYASKPMLRDILNDKSLHQLVNTACMPGIVGYALAMPDIHQGYGFPIGGVVATNTNAGGVISPGGIGYDINCGVRLLTLDIETRELQKYKDTFADALFRAVPSGVGQAGQYNLNASEIDNVLLRGIDWCLERGYAVPEDALFCEENGRMDAADPAMVSELAKKRGADQLGTLGSGNHFLEVQQVSEIFDKQAADAFGLHKNQIVLMIHCGSRGLGHQVCTDYVGAMMNASEQYDFTLPDRELICAPTNSNMGQRYYAAMCAAANFAWANRQLITHAVRQAVRHLFSSSVEVRLLYDVSHNMGKKEKHLFDGVEYDLLVHRKGATRSFSAGNPFIPERYSHVGQPVLIPGTMGTASYVLAGAPGAMQQTFGSSCHGAGRKLSRAAAKKRFSYAQLSKDLNNHDIVIRCDSAGGLLEEAPEAYKDVESVVGVVHQAGIASKVAQLIPTIVVKGG